MRCCNMFKVFLFLGFMTICSCKGDKQGVNNDPSKDQVENSELEKVTYDFHALNLSITFNSDGSNSLSTSDKAVVEKYILEKSIDRTFVSISDIEAFLKYDGDADRKEVITFQGKGHFPGSPMSLVAVEFSDDGDGKGSSDFGMGGSVRMHGCHAAPCEGCTFLYRSVDNVVLGHIGKTIVGCSCDESGEEFRSDGLCNHSITQFPSDY